MQLLGFAHICFLRACRWTGFRFADPAGRRASGDVDGGVGDGARSLARGGVEAEAVGDRPHRRLRCGSFSGRRGGAAPREELLDGRSRRPLGALRQRHREGVLLAAAAGGGGGALPVVADGGGRQADEAAAAAAAACGRCDGSGGGLGDARAALPGEGDGGGGREVRGSLIPGGGSTAVQTAAPPGNLPRTRRRSGVFEGGERRPHLPLDNRGEKQRKQ